MARILIVYGTHHGHTARICERISIGLEEAGHHVAVHPLPHPVTPEGFDGVVVAGSIRFGRYPKEVERWVSSHRDALDATHSAFVSVSMSLAEEGEANVERAHDYVTAFEGRTDWHPEVVEELAGALQYTQYNVFVRFMLKQIAKQGGLSTDTAHDHDYTDWAEVDRFTAAFGDMVASDVRAAG